MTASCGEPEAANNVEGSRGTEYDHDAISCDNVGTNYATFLMPQLHPAEEAKTSLINLEASSVSMWPRRVVSPST